MGSTDERCAGSTDSGSLLSTRWFQPLVDLVENQLGDPETTRWLHDAGTSPEEIRDPEGWIGVDVAERLNELAAERTGDPQIIRRAGRAALSERYLGTAFLIMRGLGAMGLLPALRFFSAIPLTRRTSHWSLDDLGPDNAWFSFRTAAGVRDHPTFCENRLGALEAVPGLLGLPGGRVEHPQCIHHGGDRCVYRMSWSRPLGASRFAPGMILGVALCLNVVAAVLLLTGLLAEDIRVLRVSAGVPVVMAAFVMVWCYRVQQRHLSSARQEIRRLLDALRREHSENAQKLAGLDLLHKVRNMDAPGRVDRQHLDRVMGTLALNLDFAFVGYYTLEGGRLRGGGFHGSPELRDRLPEVVHRVLMAAKPGVSPDAVPDRLPWTRPQRIPLNEELLHELPAHVRQGLVAQDLSEVGLAPVLSPGHDGPPVSALLFARRKEERPMSSIDLSVCAMVAGELPIPAESDPSEPPAAGE